MQRFAAREKFEFSNGAIGWRPGGPMECLGPYAKIQACPIAGTNIKRTAYATSYADTMWSIPACTRYKGKYIKGHFSYLDCGGIEFRPFDEYKKLLPMLDSSEKAC